MKRSYTDIVELSSALNAGEINASYLLEQELADIERRQVMLNCYVELDEVGARRSAEYSDRRRRSGKALSLLDGVPIALKDNIDAENMATRNGSKYSHRVSGEAVVSTALREAGAIIMGKLNMDECAIGGVTDNPHDGPTDNPWKPGFVPGGSSGGSGSAVAGGLAWAALGTDTLGSVRLPAAYCGIVGLKATRGLISMDGIVPLSPTFDHVGPLCRSVRDARLLLDVLVGSPPPDWSIDIDRRLNGARLGIFAAEINQLSEPVIADGFYRAIEDARGAGAEIIEMNLKEMDLNDLRLAAFLKIERDGALALSGPLRDHPEAYSESLLAILNYGRNMSPVRLHDAMKKLNRARAVLFSLFEEVEFLATPTAPQLAFPRTQPAPTNQAIFTGLANIYGGPAISLPSAISDEGLPLAFHLMAAPNQEAHLLNAAEDLEGQWGRFVPPDP